MPIGVALLLGSGDVLTYRERHEVHELLRVDAEQGRAEQLVALGIDHELDEAARLAEDPRRHRRNL